MTHHAGVFMLQNVAVEHVRIIRVGEVTEMADDSDLFSWHDQHGVFRPSSFSGGGDPSLVKTKSADASRRLGRSAAAQEFRQERVDSGQFV